jgi:hypothetical protein
MIKREWKILLVVLTLTVLLSGVVLAEPLLDIFNLQYNPPANAPKIATVGPDASTWYGVVIVDWLGLGETWALVISSLMVMLIVISGLYDILGTFSAFSNKYVMFLIAFGIGVIAGVSGAVRALALFFFSIGAGLGALGIAIGIIIPVAIFVIVNWTFFRIFRNIKTSGTNKEIDAGAKEAAQAAASLGTVAKGFRQAKTNAEA